MKNIVNFMYPDNITIINNKHKYTFMKYINDSEQDRENIESVIYDDYDDYEYHVRIFSDELRNLYNLIEQRLLNNDLERLHNSFELMTSYYKLDVFEKYCDKLINVLKQDNVNDYIEEFDENLLFKNLTMMISIYVDDNHIDISDYTNINMSQKQHVIDVLLHCLSIR